MSSENLKHEYCHEEEEKKLREARDVIVAQTDAAEDPENYIISVKKSDGTTEQHYISKRAGGGDYTKMYIVGIGNVEKTKIIRAIRDIFPEMEHQNLAEAIKILDARLKQDGEKTK